MPKACPVSRPDWLGVEVFAHLNKLPKMSDTRTWLRLFACAGCRSHLMLAAKTSADGGDSAGDYVLCGSYVG